MDPVHYKIILSYNGSAYAGFQRQLNARTVQGEFETSLQKLGWQGRSILSAGRTDAGVHARGQVVSFRLTWKHSIVDLQNALNYYLPEDIAVQSVSEASVDFHPRYDARIRHYRYHIFCHPVRDPLRQVFAWRVWPEVNLQRMAQAAEKLIGVHDFIAFGSPTSKGGTSIREVFSTMWRPEGDGYQFDITANGFLYHMVRRITFVLVSIGKGEAAEGLVEESLQTGEMCLTGLAPPEGLVLEEVIY